MNPITQVERAEELFKAVRLSVMDAAAALYECKQSGAWKEKYPTWLAFLNEGCGISEGFSSKLLQVYTFYVIDGGLSQLKLAGVDSERLYLALKLPSGTPTERLEVASSLSRNEIKQQTIYEKTGEECKHEEIRICSKCHKRL